MKASNRLSKMSARLLRKQSFASQADADSHFLHDQANNSKQPESSKVVVYLEFSGDPTQANPSTCDAQFLRKIQQIIEEKLTDEELDIGYLCQAVGLSSTQLFRKMKALTGESPMKFFRKIKLQRARHFLQATDLTVAEIAYDLGFSDPNYFSRAFRKEFGFTPSQIRR